MKWKKSLAAIQITLLLLSYPNPSLGETQKIKKKIACSLLLFQYFQKMAQTKSLHFSDFLHFNNIIAFLKFKPFCLIFALTHKNKLIQKKKTNKLCFFFFGRQAFANLTMLLRGASQSWSFFLNFITLYKPRMPSVLYIFIRASNIPLYCRFDGSTPASYCNTSRVFVTHIGFVMQRVMAPENRWKLD